MIVYIYKFRQINQVTATPHLIRMTPSKKFTLKHLSATHLSQSPAPAVAGITPDRVTSEPAKARTTPKRVLSEPVAARITPKLISTEPAIARTTPNQFSSTPSYL